MHRQGHSVLLLDLASIGDKLPLLSRNPTMGDVDGTGGGGSAELQTLQLLASMEHAMASTASSTAAEARINGITAENAVVVFSSSGCCMCHVVKKLFLGMGVSPKVVELDQVADGVVLEKALVRIVGEQPSVPAVFVGGKLVGGLDHLMAAHISGKLIPQLKAAGALWL